MSRPGSRRPPHLDPRRAPWPEALLALGLLVSLGRLAVAAATDAEPSPAETAATLSIEVSGALSDLVLTAPDGRTCSIAPDGTTIGFAGCERLDSHRARHNPTIIDTSRIRLARPAPGRYRFALNVRGQCEVVVRAAISFDAYSSGPATSDYVGLGALPGDEMVGVLCLFRRAGGGPDSLSVMIAELGKKRPG